MAEVELLLGGMPQMIFTDSTYQFTDPDSKTVNVYSPRLTKLELEAFCRENIKQYKQHYEQNKEAIDNHEKPAIVPFW